MKTYLGVGFAAAAVVLLWVWASGRGAAVWASLVGGAQTALGANGSASSAPSGFSPSAGQGVILPGASGSWGGSGGGTQIASVPSDTGSLASLLTLVPNLSIAGQQLSIPALQLPVSQPVENVLGSLPPLQGSGNNFANMFSLFASARQANLGAPTQATNSQGMTVQTTTGLQPFLSGSTLV